MKSKKPKCVDCNKIISGWEHKRCIVCSKKHQVGKNASNYKGVSYNCKDCGKKLANMYAKRCQPCAKTGKRNNRFGKKPNHTKRIYYKENTFRSIWEANFARWLDGSGIKWRYEPTTFHLGDTTYTPDFYLPEFDKYIEIKGYWYKENKRKFWRFKYKYKDINISIFNKKRLKNYNII